MMRTISSVYFWSWSLFLLFCIVTGKTIRSSSSSPISDLLLNSTRQALDIFDQIFSKIKDSDDILHFHGHKTFERLRNAAAVEIGGVVKYKRWSEIAKDLIKHYSLHHHNHSHTHANQSAAKFNHISSISTDKSNHSNSPTSALRLHNDLKLGDFLQLITHPHLHKKFRMQENVSINCTLESLITKERFNSYFDLGQPPIVLTNVIDENWGFLSTVIMNRTTRWINMTNHLRIHDHSYRTLSYFLKSPKVALVFCNSHVDPVIGFHPKVLSLPLGIKRTGEMWTTMRQVRDRIQGLLAQQSILKTRLLLINNSGWGHRAAVNQMISDRFNHTVRNTHAHTDEENYWSIASSQFVLCPSGFGYDTYRLWEVLLLGSIPIVESNEGFDRTYSRLPVLVVHKFDDLTPEFLNSVYTCFMTHASKFSYEHLNQRHWEELIDRSEKVGVDVIHSLMNEHPKRNPYCNYLD